MRVLLLLVVLSLGGCGAVMTQPKFGVSDSAQAEGVDRINKMSALRESGRLDLRVRALEEDLVRFSESRYAQLRLLNELADVYAFQLFDIERSIKLDEQISRLGAIDEVIDKRFFPSVSAANQRVLGGKEYVGDYISPQNRELLSLANARLLLNGALLKGVHGYGGKRVLRDLLSHLELVKSDLSTTPRGSALHWKLVSRFIRAEYEILRVNPAYRPLGGQFVSNLGDIQEKVNWQEVSFLQFSEWATQSYFHTRDVQFAQLALEISYKPYVNLRSPNARWLYNNIVNGYIDQLVKANFEAGRYDEALYYASLNKSRAVLEERLIYEQIKGGANTRLADLYAQDSVPRDKSGLPSKDWFRQQLAKAPAYLDFYVSGQFEEGKGKAAASRQATTVARAERAVMPMNARDFGVEGTTAAATGSFQDTGMYVFQVKGGKVQSARRVAGAELARLKGDLNTAFDQVSGAGPSSRNARALLSAFANGMPERYAVSADKWLSRHPLEMHLNAQVSRTLNFFTLGEPTRLAKLSVAGFFDPLGDLAGARAEADVIEAVVPGSMVRKGAQATVAELRNARNTSVVHLSMHGFFDEQNPNNSKLAFAGARKDGKPGDPNALYAKDMVGVDALRNRDLVFAAACKSGVVASDSANQNELMGILRPLTANRNRNVILSLWNVNDASAKDFVEAFYRSLGSSLNVDEAFFAAQSQVREKYKDPYHWAAFYLSKAQ